MRFVLFGLPTGIIADAAIEGKEGQQGMEAALAEEQAEAELDAEVDVEVDAEDLDDEDYEDEE